MLATLVLEVFGDVGRASSVVLDIVIINLPHPDHPRQQKTQAESLVVVLRLANACVLLRAVRIVSIIAGVASRVIDVKDEMKVCVFLPIQPSFRRSISVRGGVNGGRV